MAAAKKASSKSPAKGKPGSPDALAKAGKRGAIELSEEDLKKISGGTAIKIGAKI
jgi:bacteriocin-like protein